MKILLLNQTFYPDVVSTAQHLTDLALKLAADGHEVTVLSSRRGYDDPRVRFPKEEIWKGIRILRIPSLALGKKSKWRRAANFGSFLASCLGRLLFLPRYDVVVALTSPPLISFLGALFTRLRGGKFVFWVMDLNPDEAIAAGWLRESSLVARILQSLLRYSCRHASLIIALDRFMKERLLAKGVPEERLVVIPPWSHDDMVRYETNGRETFRAEHGLTGKFVVMYSGNHSPCHPLDTLLEAARRLRERTDIVFCFVGGGSEFGKIRDAAAREKLTSVLCLPYQPLDKLAASLSAADLHVVVMGDPFVGMVHPCKIYNILVVGAPFLYIGPPQSHVVDLARQIPLEGAARVAAHGDVEAVTRHVLEAMAAGQGRRAETGLADQFSVKSLLGRMVEEIERLPPETGRSR